MTQLDVLEQNIGDRLREKRPKIFDSGPHIEDDQFAAAVDDIVQPLLQFLHVEVVNGRVVSLSDADVIHLKNTQGARFNPWAKNPAGSLRIKLGFCAEINSVRSQSN